MAPGQLGLGVDLPEADALPLPFPDASLAIAVCVFSVRTIRDERRVVCEMNRVLRSRGLLLADRIPGST